MIRIAHIFSFFYISFIAQAQSTFRVVIEKEPPSFSFPAGSITEDINGDIYVVGTAYPDGWTSTNRLIKLDKFGNILWDTTYSHTPSYEYSPELMPTNDGGVIMASTSFSYPLYDEDTISDILVWKIDPQGTIEWQQVLSARDFYDMNTTKDGGYLLTGSIHETKYYQGMDIVAYKIDKDGNLLWSQRLGKQKTELPWEWEQPRSVIEFGKDIYVCGHNNLTNDPSKVNGLLYSLDSSGNLNWKILIPSTPQQEKVMINSVFKFNDQFYFNETFGLYAFNPENGDYWQVPDSINMGFGFKGYNYNVSCGINELKVIDKHTGGDYFLRVYDNLAEPYLEKDIPQIKATFAESIFTKDEGILILADFGDSIEVIKTDCKGNVDFWSDECDKIPDEANMLIYPNPSHDEIIIETEFDFNEVVIYSVNGEWIKYENPCICSRQTLDISELAAGVYFVKILGPNQQAISKLIKL